MSQNRLFVGFKPSGISCNKFLSQIKKKHSVKKAGYSGTLDPFAEGVLIIAFGKYAKFFRFLNKSPKVYEAVLHLGAKSETLDVEGVFEVEDVEVFDIKDIEKAASKLTGRITYKPPKFSAKKIDGKRAYALARENQKVELKDITTEVFYMDIKNYAHPFITFEIKLSEGGYVRSFGKMLAELLGVEGSLKKLCRINEGAFFYEDEKELNPMDFLNIQENFYNGNHEDLTLGRVLNKNDFLIRENGEYFVRNNNCISIVKIDENVKYLLNNMELH